MPVHDWTLVDAGVFHDFHQGWAISISNVLNNGLLNVDFYAMVERTRFNHDVDLDLYEARSTDVVVRHVSGDQIIGFIEIVSPGNKHSATALRIFVEKLGAAMRSGCHLLVIDLHPPTPRDPRGVHAKFWEDSYGDATAPGVDLENPLGMSAYVAAMRPVAYFEPFAVGSTLIEMPIFLTQDRYINVPLERTYMEAWQGVPRRWREVIDKR